MAARGLAAVAALVAVASARAQEREACQTITVPGQAEREFCLSANGATLQLTVSPVGEGFFAAGIMFPGNDKDDNEGYFGKANQNEGKIGAVAGISHTETCYRKNQGPITRCAFTRILPFTGGRNFPVSRCSESSTECKLGQEILSKTMDDTNLGYELSGDIATLTVTLDEQYANLTSVDIITASLTQPEPKDNTVAIEAGTVTKFNLGGDVEPTEGPSATPSAAPTTSPTFDEGSTSPSTSPTTAPSSGGTDNNITDAPTASPVVGATESPTASPTESPTPSSTTLPPTVPLGQEFSRDILGNKGKVFYTARDGGAVDFEVQLDRDLLQDNGFIGVGVSNDGNMVGSFAVVASLVDGAAQGLKTYALNGKDSNLVEEYVESRRRAQGSGCDTDDDLSVNENTLEITFCRNKIGDLDVIDSEGNLRHLIFAYGNSPDLTAGHTPQSRQALAATFEDQTTQAPTPSNNGGGDDDEGDDDDDSNGGMIAGIVIAVLAVIAIVVATILCLRKKNNDRAPRQLPTKNEHAHPAGTAQHTQEPKVVVDKPAGPGAAMPPNTAAPQQVTRN